jgi:hypothetical protein
MKLVILESPYGAVDEPTLWRNIGYLDRAIRDSVLRNEAPIASHRLYPGALDEGDLYERNLGIQCGYAWWAAAEAVVFYTDFGWTAGMKAALVRARNSLLPVEERTISHLAN